VHELNELQRHGMSLQRISQLRGWDRKTIRKYLQRPKALPEYGPWQGQAAKLDPFKAYLK
jgi:transposase